MQTVLCRAPGPLKETPRMDLLLWRHAQAVDINNTMNDLDRPLTRNGETQAAEMAAWL